MRTCRGGREKDRTNKHFKVQVHPSFPCMHKGLLVEKERNADAIRQCKNLPELPCMHTPLLASKEKEAMLPGNAKSRCAQASLACIKACYVFTGETKQCRRGIQHRGVPKLSMHAYKLTVTIYSYLQQDAPSLLKTSQLKALQISPTISKHKHNIQLISRESIHSIIL